MRPIQITLPPASIALGLAIALGVATLLSMRQAGPPTVVKAVSGEPGTPITELPFTIDRCGRFYLTKCLRGVAGQDGVTVSADDVTLDLNGFSLVGVAGSLSGIVVAGPAENLTVRNGTVRGWGLHGVDSTSAADVLVERVRASGNGGSGIECGGERSTVRRCTASLNQDGIVGAELIEGCVARENTGDGLAAGPGAAILDSVANANGASGIVATDSLVAASVAVLNGASDFDLTSSTKVDCHRPDPVDAGGPFETLVYNVEGSFGTAVELIPGRVLVHSVSAIETHALFFDGPGQGSNSGTIKFVSGDGIAIVSSHSDEIATSSQTLDVIVENGLYLSKFEGPGTQTDYVVVSYRALP